MRSQDRQQQRVAHARQPQPLPPTMPQRVTCVVLDAIDGPEHGSPGRSVNDCGRHVRHPPMPRTSSAAHQIALVAHATGGFVHSKGASNRAWERPDGALLCSHITITCCIAASIRPACAAFHSWQFPQHEPELAASRSRPQRRRNSALRHIATATCEHPNKPRQAHLLPP